MDAATIALFELANISALIVDTDEDTTLSVAQVAAAFGVCPSSPLFRYSIPLLLSFISSSTASQLHPNIYSAGSCDFLKFNH